MGIEFSRSQLLVLDDKNVTFPLVEREGIFHIWVFNLPERKGEVRMLFLELHSLSAFDSK